MHDACSVTSPYVCPSHVVFPSRLFLCAVMFVMMDGNGALRTHRATVPAVLTRDTRSFHQNTGLQVIVGRVVNMVGGGAQSRKCIPHISWLRVKKC